MRGVRDRPLTRADAVEGEPSRNIRCAAASAPDIQPDLLRPVVSRAELGLEPEDLVFVVLPRRPVGKDGYRMEVGVVVPPELESLDEAHTPYTPESVSTSVDVRPDDVDVVIA